MMSIARIGSLALGTAIAINLCADVRGQSCPLGSSQTVTRVSGGIGPLPPPWSGLPIDVPQFQPIPGQVLLQADLTATVSVSGSTRFENLSTTSGLCVFMWSLGSNVQVEVPIPNQQPMLAQAIVSGSNPLTSFDGILDYQGTSGATNDGLFSQQAVSLTINDQAVLGTVLSGSGVVHFTSDANDVSNYVGSGNSAAIFINNTTITITIAYTYCSPGFDFCVPGQQGVLACPCGNPQQRAGAFKGCDNSAGTGGAVLHSGGAASLAADSVQFTSTGETPNATTIFLQGTASLAGGAVFGQGVRCTDGSLLRLYVKTASNGTASAPTGSDARVSARSLALGDSIVAGTPRFYSAYYRDSTVLGGCPSTSTFNTTQGQFLTWVP